VLRSEGELADLAPTVLHLLALTIPLEMGGTPITMPP
jgi:bisphosphoglycerate-independent phosphoglycerate mutase (AlkP superfamily)